MPVRSLKAIATIYLFCVSFASTHATELIDFQAIDQEEREDQISIYPLACQAATAGQISVINTGFAKLQKFLEMCAKATSGSRWCNQLTRPNPDSSKIFHCTYGTSQPHILVHPDEGTWVNAFQAVKLVEELEAMGVKTCIIYNWWRPEPYNKNVGGAPGRHPFGTSVDVRFCSMDEMSKAHAQLCQWRKQGRLRALGYYGTTALHFGIGDADDNTWGKDCPN